MKPYIIEAVLILLGVFGIGIVGYVAHSIVKFIVKVEVNRIERFLLGGIGLLVLRHFLYQKAIIKTFVPNSCQRKISTQKGISENALIPCRY